MRQNSYYSHGPLVPLIAIFVVWANRKRMAQIKIKPSWLGLPLILLSVPIFVFGRWTGSGVLCGITFFTFMIGASVMFMGMRMTRLLLFPILFMISMIPAPATVLDNATSRIQIQSTTVAAHFLQWSQASDDEIHQEGSIIRSDSIPAKDHESIVGTACSGFRLLISLLTFTAFFVYMIQAPTWKKVLLVALSFPLSLFINALRIAMIGWVGILSQSSDAMHQFHDFSGYIGLVVCFAILFGIARLIGANDFGIPDPEVVVPTDAMTPAYKLVGRGYRGAICVALFGAILLSNVMIRPLELTVKGYLAREDIPKSFGDWVSEDVPVDKDTMAALPTADMLQRVYRNVQDGRLVIVFVESAKDTDAFHDPHSCLPGGGNPVTQDQKVTISVEEPVRMNIPASLLASSDPNALARLHLYWYMSGRKVCSSTSSVRRTMRSIQVRNLLDLVAHPGDRDAIRRRIDSRQWRWYRFSTEVWQDSETDAATLEQFVKDFIANTRHFGE